MTVKITADSTCDLSPELIRQYGITITPLYITQDGQNYRDGLEITPDDIFRYVEETGKMCSTAAVNVEDYTACFSRALQQADGIVHFTISSDMSSCYQNACIAAAEFSDVYVIDSRNLSTGIGLLVLDAAELAAEGRTAREIFSILEEKKKKLDVSFVIDTLTYLHKGGRCSAVAALGANLLSLKPSIAVKDGSMGVAKKYRGKLEKCLQQYIREQLADPDTIDTKRIFVTHSRMDPALVNVCRQTVEACMHFDEILETEAGCTVSNHCGPNCLGILFYRK